MRKQKKFSFILFFALFLSFITPLSCIYAAGTSTLEINQVLSYGMDITNGKLFEISNFVAGKSTSLFVQSEDKILIDPSGQTQYVTVYYKGREIAKLLPAGTGTTKLLEFKPKTLEEVGNWKAGQYQFTAVVNGETFTKTATFSKTKSIDILVIPIKGRIGKKITKPTGLYKTAYQFTEECFPIAKGGINWVIGKQIDLSAKKYNLETENGWDLVFNHVYSIKKKKKDYDIVMGFVSAKGATSRYQGMGGNDGATVVIESDSDMEATVAHEIAHCYDIGDEYDGGAYVERPNPMPYKMKGYDWYTGKSVKSKYSYLIGGESLGLDGTGTVIKENQRPNSTSQGLLKTPTSFMGSGDTELYHYWTTSSIYNHLFKEFAIGKTILGNETGTIDSEETMPSSDDVASEDGTFTPNEDQDTGYFDDTLICEMCYYIGDSEEFIFYGYCSSCEEVTLVPDITEDKFQCSDCGSKNFISSDTLLAECPDCNYFMWYDYFFGLAFKQKQFICKRE